MLTLNWPSKSGKYSKEDNLNVFNYLDKYQDNFSININFI